MQKWEYCRMTWVMMVADDDRVEFLRVRGFSEHIYLTAEQRRFLDARWDAQRIACYGFLDYAVTTAGARQELVENQLKTLAELGAQGWEMITCLRGLQGQDLDYKEFYFKRPIT